MKDSNIKCARLPTIEACLSPPLGLMVNVTYNIPETGSLVLYPVRLLSLRVIYALTSLFSSQITLLSASRLSVLLTALVLSFIFSLIFRRNLKDKDGHSIPPGPPLRYPYLGRCPERTLQAWSRTYGPLFSVWMGNQLFVVISDARIAKDLLVSNGAIFSSRKQYFIKSQTILHGRGITATAYSDKW